MNVSFTGINWNVPQTVTVTAYDDPTVELTHSCVITHTINSPDPVYADLDDAPPFEFTPASITATIDDFIPSILLNDPPNVVITTGGDISVSEATPNLADTFTVVLFRQPLNENVTINLTASVDPRIPGAQVLLQDDDPGTPTAPAGTLSLVFTPQNWDTPQTVRVFAFDDDYDETDPHFAQISAAIDSAAVGFNDSANRKFVVDGVESVNSASLPVTITDDDTSSVDVAIGDGVTITEGGTGDSFTFTLGSHPYADVTVRVDPDDQCDIGAGAGAAVDVDVLADNWNQTQTVNVTAVDDPFIEGAHTCVITVVSFSTGDTLYDNLAANPNPVTATVNDNDFPRIIITTVDGIVLDEDDVAATDEYTVVLTSYADADVTVNLTISDGQSLVSSGGTPAASLALTFTSANWNVPQTVTTTVVDDAVDEANPHSGTIAHSIISSATGYGTAPEFYIDGSPATTLNLVIADNDLAGVTVIDGTSVAVTEGGTTDTYWFVLDTQPAADVYIEVDPDDECDLGAGTGAAITVTLTASDWNISHPVTVTAVNDMRVEGSHSCLITHVATSADPLYHNTPIADVTATITDDDLPRIAINTSGGVAVSEDTPGTADTYTVVLLGEPLADVQVGITVLDGQTQISDGGAAGTTLTLTFSSGNWNVAQTVSVFAVDDILDEADPHTGVIHHTATSTAPGYSTSTVFVLDGVDNISTVSVSIADNDTPSIDIVESDGNTAVSEGGATDTYTVALGLPPLADVFVSVDPSNQCDLGAGAGATVVLTFTQTDSGTPQTITVSAVDDLIAEGTHTCTITHTASSSDPSYSNFSGTPVTVTITDNDTAQLIVTQSDGVTHVFEGGATDTYEVVLGSQPTSVVTITVTFGSQCSVTPISFSFDATTWATPRTVTVSAIDDTVLEPSPLNCIVINTATSGDSNYNGIAVALTAQVFDDDGADLIITQSTGSTDVNEAGTTSDTYNLSLAVVPYGDVTVSLTADGQCSIYPASVSFTTANWSIAQTVTVTAVDDSVAESSPHPCVVTHIVSSSDSRYNLIRTLSVNVIDDDISGLVITETDGNTTVNEADTSTADIYALTLPSDPGGTVNVSIATNGQCNVNPPTVTMDSSNWSSPQIISVTAVDDTLPEASPHPCVITHTMSGAATGVSVLNAFVLDDDTTSIIVLPTGGSSEVREEGETTDTIQVRLGTAPTADVYVDVSSDSQCVIESPPLPLTFTIANWNTAQLVTVRAVDDADDEATHHPCQISLSSVSTDPNYTGLSAQHTVMVVDNDGADVDTGNPGFTPAEYPTPPATPLCMDQNFDPTSPVRASVPDSYRSAVFCRLLVQNRQYINYLSYQLTHPSQIGLENVLDLGVEQAVDVFSPTGPQQYVNGAVICLRGNGTMLFLSANQSPRTAQVMMSYPVDDFPGYTCVTLPEPGTLVMVNGTVEQPATPTPTGGVMELNQCAVTTQYIIRFRATPGLDGEILDRVPYLARLQATGYVPGWYRVIFGDTQGWVSANLVITDGNCGT